MRHSFMILAAVAVVALVATAAAPPAHAAARVTQGSILDDPAAVGSCQSDRVTTRQWSGSDNTLFNAGACGSAGVGDCGADPGVNGSQCNRDRLTNVGGSGRAGYVSHADNLANYAGGVDNQNFFLLWDAREGTGAAWTGYYSIHSQLVNSSNVGGIGDNNCAGTTAFSCFLPGYFTNLGDNRRAPDQSNTRTGTLSGYGGFDSTPVPRVSSVAGSTVNLTWDSVYTGKSKDSVAIPFKHYKLYRAIDNNGDNICTIRPRGEANWTLIGTPTTNSFADTLPTFTGTEDCTFYAIRLAFNGPSGVANGPDAAAGEVVSSWKSAQSAGVTVNPSAIQITNFVVTYAGKNSFNIGWTSGVEGDLRGYYVLRGTSEAGPFSRVSPEIAVTGDGSDYSFLDKVKRGESSVFYYKLEGINSDNTSDILTNAEQAMLPFGKKTGNKSIGTAN